MKKIMLVLFLAIVTSSAFASSYECERAIVQVGTLGHYRAEVFIEIANTPKEMVSDAQNLKMMLANVEYNEAVAEAKKICK